MYAPLSIYSCTIRYTTIDNTVICSLMMLPLIAHYHFSIHGLLSTDDCGSSRNTLVCDNNCFGVLYGGKLCFNCKYVPTLWLRQLFVTYCLPKGTLIREFTIFLLPFYLYLYIGGFCFFERVVKYKQCKVVKFTKNVFLY